MKSPDYSLVTEAPGLQATQEQLERVYHRYHFAKQYCLNNDVVEVACGTGIGLGYLSTFSKSILGCDIDAKNLLLAREHYKDNSKIRIEKMDALQLALPDKCCDVVLLYEAIYYLEEPEKFINESRRILRDDGALIICTVNKDWKDFHPSPFTHRYFSVPELYELVRNKFSEVKILGAFRIEKGAKAAVLSLIKRLAVKFDLIPGSLRFRAYLKKIFIGKTLPLPDEVKEGMTVYEPPQNMPHNQRNTTFKILYLACKK